MRVYMREGDFTVDDLGLYPKGLKLSREEMY